MPAAALMGLHPCTARRLRQGRRRAPASRCVKSCACRIRGHVYCLHLPSLQQQLSARHPTLPRPAVREQQQVWVLAGGRGELLPFGHRGAGLFVLGAHPGQARLQEDVSEAGCITLAAASLLIVCADNPQCPVTSRPHQPAAAELAAIRTSPAPPRPIAAQTLSPCASSLMRWPRRARANR